METAHIARFRLAFCPRRLAVPQTEGIEGAFSFPRAGDGGRWGKESAMQKVSLTDKKCATCRWWQGSRDIQFRDMKPFKVECDAITAPEAYSASCPRWVAWEKLA